MWKKPNRPNHEITQAFNDGVLTVYDVSDSAQAGEMPILQFTQKAILRFEERVVGVNRFYSGMQNQIHVERVLRVPKSIPISTQDAVVVLGEDTTYRIDFIQSVYGSYPPSVDLTLVRYEQSLGGIQ